MKLILLILAKHIYWILLLHCFKINSLKGIFLRRQLLDVIQSPCKHNSLLAETNELKNKKCVKQSLGHKNDPMLCSLWNLNYEV